jgi:hypothetical protein
MIDGVIIRVINQVDNPAIQMLRLRMDVPAGVSFRLKRLKAVVDGGTLQMLDQPDWVCPV